VSQALKADTIGVYAIAAQDGEMVSVRMRDLCAGIGATEEPASGTTAATLAFVLANVGLLTSSRPRLQVDMGIEMGRPSRLMVDLDFTGGQPSLARLRGSADRVLARPDQHLLTRQRATQSGTQFRNPTSVPDQMYGQIHRQDEKV
jgi:predicted PhzF superfamily epimerase YddE/YHI9